MLIFLLFCLSTQAKNFRDMTCPRERIKRVDDTIEYKKWPVCGFDDDQFIAYGLGTFLYFRLLKCLAVLFGVLTFFSLPSLVFNASGSAIENTYYVETTLLGNQGENNLNSTLVYLSREDVGVVISSFDAAMCVLVLAFTYYMGRDTKYNMNIYEESTITSARFTVKVSNIPSDVTRAEAQRHFSQFGEVNSKFK